LIKGPRSDALTGDGGESGLMTLDAFFRAIDQHDEVVPIDELTALMRQLEISHDDVADYISFDDEHYKRNLLRLGNSYAALVLCWRDGQRSPIHDHRGSACGVRVITGVASETVYECGSDRLLVRGETRTYPAGHVCGSYDADIHEMYNDQGDGRELVTLHVYTPPLSEVTLYRLGTTETTTWADTETLVAQRALRSGAETVAATRDRSTAKP
jgi:cysteine dioxygenase